MDTEDKDKTLFPAFIWEHSNRLLGWELLSRALRQDLRPITAEELCDMIGMSANGYYQVVRDVAKKMAPSKRRIIYGRDLPSN
jgi:hypothetical protein